MIVAGDFTFRAPRSRVWALLQDPDVLKKAMPGAQRLVATGDGTYEGHIRIGVGPVTAAQWTLMVSLHDREEPARYVMKVDSKGPLGFTRGTASVELVDEPGGTTMRYHADLQIGGKVAGIGQRLLDQAAKLLTRQGLEALNREIDLRLAMSIGSATAALGFSTSPTVEAELVEIVEVSDDAAAANPESGDASYPIDSVDSTASAGAASSVDGPTASSGDGHAAAGTTSSGDGHTLSADGAASADAVEPLQEVATPGAPLAPGMPDAPAPVADLDQDLPPGTV